MAQGLCQIVDADSFVAHDLVHAGGRDDLQEGLEGLFVIGLGEEGAVFGEQMKGWGNKLAQGVHIISEAN